MKLKGSRTEQNLEAAFAGESQARNKYTYFADVAKKEGLEQVAKAFLESAENEKAHARREFDFLGGIGNTEANLRAAVEGEHHEYTHMYPEFEQIAREEGFTEIADFFKRVAKIEEQHEKKYLSLLEDIQKGTMYKKDKSTVWKCPSCGWLSEDVAAPNECPTCKLPQSGLDAYDKSGIRFGVI